jgi:hypothetical protein
MFHLPVGPEHKYVSMFNLMHKWFLDSLGTPLGWLLLLYLFTALLCTHTILIWHQIPMLGPLGPWMLWRKKQMDGNPKEHHNRVLCTPKIITWIYILRLIYHASYLTGQMFKLCTWQRNSWPCFHELYWHKMMRNFMSPLMSFWSLALIQLSGLHQKWTDKINLQVRESAAMLPGQPFNENWMICHTEFLQNWKLIRLSQSRITSIT